MKKIDETENYQIYHHKPLDGEKEGEYRKVLFFSSWSSTGIGQINGTNFFIKRGFEFIFIRSMRNHWWHTDDCLNIVQKILNDGSDWILYGSSMGGYAALYFSRMFDKFSICLSPQATVLLKNLEGEKRWINDFRQIETKFNEAELLEKKCENESLIFYDYSDTGDSIHRHYLEQKNGNSSKLVFFDVPYSGHVPIRSLLASGTLQRLLESYILRKEYNLDSLRSECLKSFNYYSTGLARYTRDNYSSLSKEVIKQHLTTIERDFNKINPDLEMSFLLAEIYSTLGDKESAVYYSSLTLNRKLKAYIIIKHFHILKNNIDYETAKNFLSNFTCAPFWSKYMDHLLNVSN